MSRSGVRRARATASSARSCWTQRCCAAANVSDAIVAFFFEALAELRAALRARGSDLALLEGDAAQQLLSLAERVDAGVLYYNVDYEPAAVERDRRVAAAARAVGMSAQTCTDHVYYGEDEVLKADGTPYTVFTPYMRRWLERRANDPRPPIESSAAAQHKFAAREAIGETREVPAPAAYGRLRPPNLPRAGEKQARDVLDTFLRERIADYAKMRDFPAAAGTSHLSPHLRAGTIGIRTCIARAEEMQRGQAAGRSGSETWVGELIWRDFYQQILAHFPRVAREPFDQRAQRIAYRDSKHDWEAWARGLTGYPIVDAAMRQINTYGWMHNRLRMIVASFL
ncbi:MAG: deoxyribodipyrimidine photo-lyase, partial [Candidatus Eremiobacteraeota bacterium]|nr:deoxyribodipyrimidine photo-lyase [Candidatus Eremiobacteraeota bacterium]